MRQDSISVMTVPATDETTAALTDWLLRELLPLMFAGAGLRCPASTLRKLPSVTARRIRSPWRLRFHARALRTAIGAAEARLAGNYAGAIEDPTHGSAGVAVPPTRVMPEQVMDAVARLSGDLDESGCEIASLANRALFAAGAVIGTGGVICRHRMHTIRSVIPTAGCLHGCGVRTRGARPTAEPMTNCRAEDRNGHRREKSFVWTTAIEDRRCIGEVVPAATVHTDGVVEPST